MNFLIWIKAHLPRVIGVALGIVAGVLCLTIGIWRTLLLVILAAVGYFIGYYLEDREKFILSFTRFVSLFRRK